MSEWFQSYYIKYMGGHIEYPKPTDCILFLYYDRMQLKFRNGSNYDTEPKITIKYETINSLENMDEKKISAKRVIGLGLVAFPLAIVGAMWKKNHIYTVIQYNDHTQPTTILLDIGDNVDSVQSWIFRRLPNSRLSSKVTPKQESIVYENRQYGFQIIYPSGWVDDELKQKIGNYTDIVMIRKFVENKSPLVTVSITDVSSSNLKSEEFVNSEIVAIKNDINMTISESSSLVIDDKPGSNLVYVDYNGYKHKIIWISSNNRVFRISYYVEKDQYLDYLPSVMEIVNSFRIGEPSVDISTEKLNGQKSVEVDNPLTILKVRFAKGEITEEQYERMHKILTDT